MDIKLFTKRAKEIRKLYLNLEKKRGRIWQPEHIAQGLAGDMGDLLKLVMAKEGLREIKDVDKKLAHELSDCLWSILILSDAYDIDIDTEYFKAMDDIEKFIKRPSSG